MKVKVDIDIKTFITFFAVAAGFVVAAYLATLLRSPLTIIFVAFFLALALNPPVTRLANLIPGHSRFWATALSYLVVITLLGGFLVLVIPPVVKQSVVLIQEVPLYFDRIENQQGPLRSFMQQYDLEPQLDNAIANAKAQASQIAQDVGATFVSGVGLILNGIVSVLTVLVLTFLMLIEGPAIMRQFWSVYTNNARRERHQQLVHKMYKVVTGYVNGQLLVAAIAAILTLIVLLILSVVFNFGLSALLPLTTIVFITTMIPLVGAIIGATIVTIVLLFTDVSAALVFLTYYLVYQQVENNFIQPTVQSRNVDLSALMVLIAILIGVSLAGLLGALVAIPVAASIKILVSYRLVRRQAEAGHKPDNMITKVKSVLANRSKEA